MILVNTDFISGKEIETLSIVKGSTIRAKHLGNDILAGLKTIVGGELTQYSEMIDEARAIATMRMVKEAEELKADAVINIRYATSNVAQGAAEVLVYGTAVVFKEKK
ncbi:MAG: YbjQ family protein [Spirochaetia bacterium]|nr:YbjQ family protein [Spirochaetia bacterium]